MKVVAIVPAAGSGRRLKTSRNKPFIKLKSKPLIFYALNALERSPLIDEIILVVAKKFVSKSHNLVRKFGFVKIKNVVAGGKTRSQSVLNGLRSIDAEDIDYVLIHDGARPFLEEALIARCIKSAKKFGASVACVSVKPTIKSEIKGFVSKTLDRSALREVQTPQVFRRDIIFKAYKNKRLIRSSTDDSKLVEALGHKVRIVKGSEKNIKVTTKEDLLLAEIIMKY